MGREMNEYELHPCIRPGYFSNVARCDDLRCDYDIKNQTVIQKQTPVDIIFIGDSITQMWELQSYFGKSGLIVLNRGIGGDHTDYLERRFYADAIQLKPKLCVLLCGINDTWALEDDDIRQIKGIDIDSVISKSKASMETIIQMAKSADMRLLICSLLPTNMKWTRKEDERKEFVKRYNCILRDLCIENEIEFVDYYPLFVAEDGRSIRKELTIDGIHPNVFGYDRMYSKLLEVISK